MSAASFRRERQQLVVGDDVVDEPPGQRGGGVEEVAGGRQLAGPADADGLGEQHVRPQSGMIPTRAWVSANAARSDATRKSHRSASSNPPVTATPLIAPMTGLPIERERAPLLRRPVVVAEGLDRRLGARPQLLEVEPGAERRVGPGEDDHVDVVVGVEIADRRGAAPAELAVERVAGAGPVERDGGDPVGDVEQQDVEAGSRSWRRTYRRLARRRQEPSSTGGRNGRVRSPSLTSVEAIQPPMALRWSSRMVPSPSVASSSS